MRDDSVEMTGEAEREAQYEAEAAEAEAAGEAEFAEEVAEMADAPVLTMSREKPDSAADPLGEAGWYLEHERVSRGLTLEAAGEATGIHPYHLEAIEWGDITCLPEREEALQMIAAYGWWLGFDPEPLAKHFAGFMPQPEFHAEPAHPANPRPLSSAKILAFARKLPKLKVGRVPGGAGGLVAGIAGAVLLFAVASYVLMPSADKLAGGGEQLSGEYPALPPPPSADPMPTASTGADTADVKVADEPMSAGQQAEAQAPAPAADGQAQEDELAGTGLNGISSLIEHTVPQSGAAAKAPAGMTAAADVSMTEEGRQFGSGNGESRLTLKAKAPVWVRIEDAQGNVVMTQMLMKGDTYRVPNREGLVVIARDGGLLTYMIDGKEKGILGTPGEILVGKSLDLKSLAG